MLNLKNHKLIINLVKFLKLLLTNYMHIVKFVQSIMFNKRVILFITKSQADTFWFTWDGKIADNMYELGKSK